MYIAFFILLGIIFLLVIPLKFNVKFNFNLLKNRGNIKLKLFSIKLLYYKLKYDNKKIKLTNFKTTKEVDLEINKQNIDLANEIQSQLIKRLYLKNLKFYFNLGVEDNPFACALLGSGMEMILSIASSIIKFHKPTADINYKISTYYNKSIGIIDVECTSSISITNLLISLFRAKSIINKKENIKNDKERRLKSKNEPKASY